MAVAAKTDIYAECSHIKRIPPDYVVNEAIAKEIGENYRTLPTFEKGLFECVYRKHYSLEGNEYLKCRWLQYKKNIDSRVFSPFTFPDIRDLHFYNGSIRFVPSQSIFRYPEYRRKLKPGPGVDHRGQMPIPQELLMKRGSHDKKDDSKEKKVKRAVKKKIIKK